jgi:hypothetical protein
MPSTRPAALFPEFLPQKPYKEERMQIIMLYAIQDIYQRATLMSGACNNPMEAA